MQATLSGVHAIAGQGGTAATTPSPRLVRAAQEFEGQMMQELLKPMTNGDALTGNDQDEASDDDSGARSGGALGEFASEALGRSLSERGGLGIANQIIQELSHPGNRHGAGKVTRNLHGGHVVRTSQ